VDESGAPESPVNVLMALTTDPESDFLLKELGAGQAVPSILVCGAGWLRLNLPTVKYVYLTCRVSDEEYWRLAGQLTALHSTKEGATIVDYAGNRARELPGDPRN
jgi:hypothetical protein